ncbi:hypothetical protein [Burkholderia pseudomallei]|uniref:hypothetical protein n=1 Tax=Burkholderia pseudomallei TaxID=28450 RepID=UPI000A8C7889|nr:hypothetical protein [Burkholderia pseudomallei]
MRVKNVATFVAAAVACSSQAVGAADQWVLVRDHDGTCSVQPSTARPLLGSEMDRADTKQQTCKELLDRYESATDDPKKCGNYTENVRALCTNAGVDLPDPNH